MPKIEIPGPYRFHFFSHEPDEPPHVHIKRDKAICKFWLGPVSIARNQGFRPHELKKIARFVEAHRERIEAAWHEYFQDR